MAKTVSVPYANATTGAAARDDITRMLRRFGCTNVGFMDNFDEHSVLLAFIHRGRNVQLRASAKGWAAMYLQSNPWTSRKRVSRSVYEAQALEQGSVAINSILRDWVKGSITAVECGILSFGAVFMPFTLDSQGRSMIEYVEQQGLLPLVPTARVRGLIVNGVDRFANQTDSGQNRLSPSDDRWIERSKTYPGIAAAMGDQWGNETSIERDLFAFTE